MCSAALAGELEEAAKLDQELSGLHHALFVEANPIPVKWAVAELGLIKRGIRLPLTWLSPGAEDRVRDAMRQAKVI